MLILTPSDTATSAAASAGASLDWALSPNGQLLGEHGSASASALPAQKGDNEVVLVLPLRAVSWHRVQLPRVAAGRLRAALDGLLEERLLGDTDALHFALEPGAKAGQSLWVAACHKAWLRGWLQVLEAAGRPVTRIVPALWPQASGQSLVWAVQQDGAPWLAWASEHGLACLPLHPGAAQALAALAPPDNTAPSTPRWLAEPAAAATAEELLDQRFEPVPAPAWLLRCAQSDWNLAQFDLRLSGGARRSQRLRQALRQLRSAPQWRPLRWGLVALLLAQVIGLNAVAWQESRTIEAKQQALRQTLQQTFPAVKLVLDAPLQMQRELQQLSQASGQLTRADLEAMLAALAEAAPDPNLAAGRIGFAPGEGRFDDWRGRDAGLSALQQALQQQGWMARLEGGQLTLRSATAP